jgi:hypothetical protein
MRSGSTPRRLRGTHHSPTVGQARRGATAPAPLQVLVVRVLVGVLQIGLVHMRVGVLAPTRVGVRVLVLHMLVPMAGMRVRVRHLAVAVLMGMCTIVGVLLGHRFSLSVR